MVKKATGTRIGNQSSFSLGNKTRIIKNLSLIGRSTIHLQIIRSRMVHIVLSMLGNQRTAKKKNLCGIKGKSDCKKTFC